jgi:RNA polymerase sigma-70 factor (ECF subfamily)
MAVVRSRRRETDRDDAMIRALYAEHGRALLAYATRLTGDPSAAEDVVQETIVRAWRHPEALVDSRPIRPWLFTVVRNLATDRVRARAARPVESAETLTHQPVEQDHSDGVVDSLVVLAALDRLSAPQRDVLVQLYYQGRTVTEAADVLGIPPGTVKSRSYHALRALREVFGGPQVVLKGVAG